VPKEIELTKGHKAIVDDDDFDWVSQFKWISTSNGKRVRAGRWTRNEDGERKFIFLYRSIMEKHGLMAPDRPEIDHINGDSLDDRKSNLRCCTRAENLRNRWGSSMSHTGVKGVSWNAANRNWNAQIGLDGRKIHLGTFSTIEEAKKAYDRAAAGLFGDFVRSGDHRGDRVELP